MTGVSELLRTGAGALDNLEGAALAAGATESTAATIQVGAVTLPPGTSSTELNANSLLSMLNEKPVLEQPKLGLAGNVSTLTGTASAALSAVTNSVALSAVTASAAGQDLKSDSVTLSTLTDSAAVKNLLDLSVEVLAEILQEAQKKNSITAIKTQVESNASTRQEENQKKLKELGKQIDKLQEQINMSPLKKALSYLKGIFQMIGAAIAVVAAVATANPVAIAGAVLGCFLALDAALSTFSEGKISMSAGIAKACGDNSKLAAIISTVVSVTLTLAAVAMSVGGNAYAALKGTVEAAKQTLAQAATIADAVNSAANATATVGSASLNIVSAVNEEKIAQSQAQVLDIQAILAELQASDDASLEHIKELLGQCDDLQANVEGILDNLNQALKAGVGATLSV